jgi:hypothetical protein
MAIDKYFMEKINRIIAEAIEHGGDCGGAYFSNRDGLVDEMKDFLCWAGLDKDYGIMDDGGWIKFYKKSDIVE